MNILDQIILEKRKEVSDKKQSQPISELEKKYFFQRKCLDFKEFLLDENRTGIIAEFKRKSPSKGVINNTALVSEVSAGYAAYGASAISILTDEQFFGGSLEDLLIARKENIPLLRKDFIIDEYQVLESKAYGADIILLIAACLTRKEVQHLAKTARTLGLNVLLEIHDEVELDYMCDEVDAIGINNRDLKTFTVDIKKSIALANKIGNGKMKIAESGISDANFVKKLRVGGFNGFLIGELFMKKPDPAAAFNVFTKELIKNA